MRTIVMLVASMLLAGCASEPVPPSCADQGPLRPINWPAGQGPYDSAPNVAPHAARPFGNKPWVKQ